MKKAIFALFVGVMVSSCLAQFPGVLSYDIETTRYVAQDLQLRRGETKVIQFNFLQTNAPLAIPTNAVTLFNYKQVNSTSGYYVITGAVYASTGTNSVRATWGASNNPSWKVSDYDVTVTTSNGVLCRAFGRLNLDSQVSVGIPTNNAGAVYAIDWAAVQNQNVGSAPFPNGAGYIQSNQVDGVSITWTAGKIGAVAAVSPDYTARSNIASHVADLANPHQVTAAQAGAATPDYVTNAVNVATQGLASASSLARYVATNDTRYLAAVTNETDPVLVGKLANYDIPSFDTGLGAYRFNRGQDGITGMVHDVSWIFQKTSEDSYQYYLNLITGDLLGQDLEVTDLRYWKMNGEIIATRPWVITNAVPYARTVAINNIVGNLGESNLNYTITESDPIATNWFATNTYVKSMAGIVTSAVFAAQDDVTVSDGVINIGTNLLGGGSGGGGVAELSPWTNDVSADGWSLTGAGNLTATGKVTALQVWLATNFYFYFNGTGIVSVIP